MKTLNQFLIISILASQVYTNFAMANAIDDQEDTVLDLHYSGQRPVEKITSAPSSESSSLKDLLKKKSTVSLLSDVLQNNITKKQDERIKYYEDSCVMIGTIIKERLEHKKDSQQETMSKASDELVLLTLTRTQYALNSVKNILGGNVDMSINWLETFYQNAFLLAKSIAASPYAGMSRGEFGRRFSILVGNKRVEDISYPAKAKLAIIQLLMIEKDLKADPAVNFPEIQDVLTDIALLREQSSSYKDLLNQLQTSKLNPGNYDVVSSDIKTITDKLDQALIDSGSTKL
jgi:hypothetical protein